MKIHPLFFLPFCFAAILSCSGCTSLADPDKEQPAAEASAPAEKQKVGESLILAFMKDKPDLFISQLPEEARKDFTKKDFEITRKSMLEKLGDPVSYEFITNLEHPIATVSVWRIRFRRDSSDKSRKIYQETLFRAISGKIDGKDVLLSFNFL